MIKSFQIEGYKKFENITFNDLSRINIFLGNNNVGKTTILEAVFAAACGTNFYPILMNSILKNNEPINAYDFSEKILNSFYNSEKVPFEFNFKFTDEDDKKVVINHKFEPEDIFYEIKPNLGISFLEQINIRSKISRLRKHIAKWKISVNNFKSGDNYTAKIGRNIGLVYPLLSTNLNGESIIQSRFNDILSHRNEKENSAVFSYLKRDTSGLFNEFTNELSRTFGYIDSIDSIPYPDGSASPVYIRMKDGKLIPLYNFGDGVQRWYNILGNMVMVKNGIHCLEEADVTFHPTAQGELAKNLMYYSKKFNNQLFMTSHSIEFLDNFLKAISEEDLDKVRVITLKYIDSKNETKFRVLSGSEALRDREENSLELR